MSDLSFDLEHWPRRRLADGVVFEDPRGRARIRLRPRVRPARFEAVLGEVVESHGVETPETIHRRRTVFGGELGVVAVGSIAKHRELAIAIVGDGPFACIDAVGDLGTRVALMVEVVASKIGLARGPRRTRMFEYEPPPGWRGIRRDGATLWLHPATPRTRAEVWIYDARPLSASTNERLHRRLFLQLAERADAGGDSSTVENDFGLNGRCVVRIAGPNVRKAAVLGDDHFMYQATLEASRSDDGTIAVFDRLLQSFRALPFWSAQGTGLFQHLAD